MNLLPLAERYNLKSLSLFCREALSTNINIDHAAEIAAISEQHNLKDLKEKAVNVKHKT